MRGNFGGEGGVVGIMGVVVPVWKAVVGERRE